MRRKSWTLESGTGKGFLKGQWFLSNAGRLHNDNFWNENTIIISKKRQNFENCNKKTKFISIFRRYSFYLLTFCTIVMFFFQKLSLRLTFCECFTINNLKKLLLLDNARPCGKTKFYNLIKLIIKSNDSGGFVVATSFDTEMMKNPLRHCLQCGEDKTIETSAKICQQ